MKLSELGEFVLIDRVTKNLPVNQSKVLMGIGDDAAVLRTDRDKLLLMTTDMLVEGVHFSFDYARPREIGKKSLVVNISDIAAMGGLPTHGTVAIGIPPGFTVKKTEALYAGLREACTEYKVNIVGGDTVKSPERLVINITLLGEIEAFRITYRSGAKPGDIIAVTGPLGGSAAGLYLLQHPDPAFPKDLTKNLRNRHLNPGARVREGRLLSGSGAVTAMNDISDGLASEINEICRASGAGCILRAADIPVDKAAGRLADNCSLSPLEWALYGGEDYELVVTVKPERLTELKRLLEKQGYFLHVCGEVTGHDEGCRLQQPDGGFTPLEPGGYNHFRGDETS
jgi:thiamine-monophosphate kinase